MSDTARKRVAVVGGGIAGLYAAWKLARKFRHSVSLFEAAERLGGRIYSVKLPFLSMPVELGAMRYYEDCHPNLSGLIHTLSLNQRDNRGAFDFTTSYYLRGNPDTSHFFLKPWETNKPGDLILYAIWRALKDLHDSPKSKFLLKPKTIRELQQLLGAPGDFDNFDKFKEKVKTLHSLAEKDWWKDIATNGRLPAESTHADANLHNMGFWNFLAFYLSNEAFHLAHDGLGYDSIVSNWNAAEAIPWFITDFSDPSRYKMLKPGFSALVQKLEDELKKQKNVSIQKGYRLQSLELAAPRSFSGGATDTKYILRFVNGDSWEADYVILALSRAALAHLDSQGAGPNRWETFRTGYVRTVRGHRLLKCFLLYESAWWDAQPNEPAKRICTDLPLRQVYYFDRDWIDRHSTAEERERAKTEIEASGDDALKKAFDSRQGPALVMASYSDAHHAAFWHPVLRRDTFPRPYNTDEDLDPYWPPDEALKLRLLHHEAYRNPDPLLATRRMVDKITEQLKTIERATRGLNAEKKRQIERPLLALYKDWNPSPQSSFPNAGWHSWEVRTRRPDVETFLDQMAQDDHLLICGEAYSDNQGWIEGALRSTDRVLKKAQLI